MGATGGGYVVDTAAILAGRIPPTLQARGEAYGSPETCLREVAFGWNWWLKVRGRCAGQR